VFAHLVHVTLGRVHECVFGVLAAGRPNFVRALLRSSITSSSRLARRRSTARRDAELGRRCPAVMGPISATIADVNDTPPLRRRRSRT
jgi:hypothetical protein